VYQGVAAFYLPFWCKSQDYNEWGGVWQGQLWDNYGPWHLGTDEKAA
jgi:hypothetical protein